MVFIASTSIDHEIFMRGIGSDIQGAGADNPIGIFVDGVYMSRNTGSQLGIFDLERVEVLKGPQSLRFGKNVVGGLIHYVTNKPTDKFEGDFNVTVGDYNRLDLSAAVRGPINDNWSYGTVKLTRICSFSRRNRFQPGPKISNLAGIAINEISMKSVNLTIPFQA